MREHMLCCIVACAASYDVPCWGLAAGGKSKGRKRNAPEPATKAEAPAAAGVYAPQPEAPPTPPEDEERAVNSALKTLVAQAVGEDRG